MEDSNTDTTWTPVVHQSSHRLTATITWHVFRLSDLSDFVWRPGESFLMQLPSNIDLTGHQHSDPASRQLYFTPCNSPRHGTTGGQRIEFILRSGRLSSLIATPRFESLRAEICLVGSGFDLHPINRNDLQTIPIAGGTGISPFLALSSPTSDCEASNSRRILFWSLHVGDLALALYVLLNNYLPMEGWKMVTIFVTKGLDTITTSTVETQCRQIWSHLPSATQDQVQFCCRRMTEQDIQGVQKADEIAETEQTIIYFCGSKSLQWQIKRWVIGTTLKVLTIPIPESVGRK